MIPLIIRFLKVEVNWNTGDRHDVCVNYLTLEISKSLLSFRISTNQGNDVLSFMCLSTLGAGCPSNWVISLSGGSGDLRITAVESQVS